MRSATELVAAVEAQGGRVRLVGDEVRVALPVGVAAAELVAELREARAELVAELRGRRLAAIVASRRRCSAASGQAEGDAGTRAAGNAWCSVAEAFVRGSADLAAVEAAEANVIAAWQARGEQPSRIVGEDDDDEGPHPPGFGGVADRITFATRSEDEQREHDCWFPGLWAFPAADGSNVPTQKTARLVEALKADGAELALGDEGVWCRGRTSVLRKHGPALEVELHRLAEWLRRGEALGAAGDQASPDCDGTAAAVRP